MIQGAFPAGGGAAPGCKPRIGPATVRRLREALGPEAMIRLEARGEQLLFTVHDEIVGLDRGTSVEALTACMTEQPSFWKGIPLDAEVHITNRYQK